MRAVLFVLSPLAVAAVAALPAAAERVPLRPEDKRAESTHIVTGMVRGVYSRDKETGSYGPGTVETQFVIEIEIKTVEKGAGLKAGDLVYARSWRLKKRGTFGNRPGPSGHFFIPQEGDAVRAYLARGHYPPTGQGDNGYAVVYPNGLDKIEIPKK
jgi:hypothetical protein